MKKIILSLLLMIQFFTRIPVNMNLPCEKEDFRRGAAFLPLIGLIIGFIQWITYNLFIKVLPVSPTIVIVLLVGIIVTGALHIDGLGDTCDGFFACKGSDKIIEIMKDSRIGTYACIAIIFDFLLKYTLLTTIAPRFSVAIIAAPIISRFTSVFLFFIGRTAKNTGTGNFFIGNIGKLQLFSSLVITIGILALIINLKYVAIVLIPSIILTALFYQFCKSRIGGITGDGLGANNELVEIFALVLIVVILKYITL